MTEPAKKDGIWIKTNHTYQRIMLNQPTVINYADTTIVNIGTMPFHTGGYFFSFPYNGYIYACSSNDKKFFRYNGSTWTDIGIAWNNWSACKSIIYNNKVHLFTFNGYSHYVFDGQSLTKISDNNLGNGMANSDNYYAGSVFVYNNKLYYNSYYRSDDERVFIYIYDEANKNWNYKSNTNNMYGGTGETCVYNGLVYIIGGYNGGTSYSPLYFNGTDLYTYNGSKFENICKLPIQMSPQMFVYNNKIYMWIFSADNPTLSTKLYTYDGSTFTLYSYTQTINNLYNVNVGNIFVYNGEIHELVSLGNNGSGSPHYVFRSASKVYDSNTLILYKGAEGGKYLTAIADTSMITDDGKNNNRFLSGFDDAIYFADTSFDWGAPMYYGDGSQWIKFKN